MVNEQNVPEVRFDGFAGAWEQHSLGEAISVASRPIDMDDDCVYQCVTAKRRNEGIVSRGFFKGSDILVKSQFKIFSGDYLISKRQVVHGANGIVPDELNDAIVSNEYLVFQDSEKLIVDFLAVASKRHAMYRAFFLSSYGVHIEKLLFDFEDWKKRTIYLPDRIEQQAITAFFRNLDNTITFKRQQYEKTVNIKKAMLEKMLPKKGAVVPEIRFEGFTRDWVEWRLGDLGRVITGNTPSTSDMRNWSIDEDGHVWITPTDINSLIISTSERRLSDMGWNKARTIPENSVLITSIASIGKNAVNTVPVAFNQQINAIVPSGNDPYFILSAMVKETHRFAGLAGQTATAIINKTEFEKFTLFVPEIQEQRTIGNFFRNLDTLIEAQREELVKVKNIKKACLNKMFV